MNKDLEKIIHETAREIAIVMFQSEDIDKITSQYRRGHFIYSVAKISSESAHKLHTETQRLIDEHSSNQDDELTWESLKDGDSIYIKIDGGWKKHVVMLRYKDGGIYLAPADGSGIGMTVFENEVEWSVVGKFTL